jgi:hypothetical protein
VLDFRASRDHGGTGGYRPARPLMWPLSRIPAIVGP